MVPLSRTRRNLQARKVMGTCSLAAVRVHRIRVARIGAALGLLMAAAAPAAAQDRADLANVSLDSLLAIPVHAASRYAQTMTDAPAAVTVITAEEISAFGYRTLDQVLARAAGFHVSNDRNYTYIGVRGFSRPTDYNNRVLLLLNGHVVNESVYGGAPIGDELGLDLALLDRVEIVRGPVSALYGSSAMFAVVNLITKRPTESLRAVQASVGDAGYREGSARAQWALPDARAILVSGRIGREDGTDLYYPEFADGESDGIARGRDWSRFASAFLSGHLRDLRVHGRVSTREKGLPTASWGSTFNHPASRTTDTYAQIAGTYQRNLAPALALDVGGAFDYYGYQGWYPYLSDETYRDETTSYRVGGTVNLAWDWSPQNRLATGSSVSRVLRGDYIWYEAGEKTIDTDRAFTSVGVWAQNETHVTPWLTTIVGGRVDMEHETRTRLTPRAAIVVRPDGETSLKLLYGTSFRSPNTYERAYAVDADGNETALVPEKIRTLEAIIERRISGSATLRVSAFDDFVTDIIDTGSDDESAVWYVNTGRIRTRGIEGEFTIVAGGWLMHGGGVLQSAVDEGTDNRLTNAPARIFRVGVNGTMLNKVSAATQFRAESSRLTLAGRETGSAYALDMTLAYRPVQGLRLSVVSTNVLNSAFSHPAGVEHLQDVIPQDGRRLRIGAEFEW